MLFETIINVIQTVRLERFSKMGVGIQDETKKLFRQEENHTEYDLIPCFNTNEGRNLVEDSEEELLSEIETDYEEDPFYSIDADVLDAAIRNLHENDDEYEII